MDLLTEIDELLIQGIEEGKYDFHWELVYSLAAAFKMPIATILKLVS